MRRKASGKRSLPGRIFRLLLWLAAAAVFYLVFAIFAPRETDTVVASRTQPLLGHVQAAMIQRFEDLTAVLEEFPSAVLAGRDGSALRLLSGTCHDFPYEDGYGRMVELTYQDSAGRQLTAVSIYPARAVSVLREGGFTLTGEGPELAGYPSLRMDSPTRIRLHMQTETGLYAVIAPRLTDAELETDIFPLLLYVQET